MIAIEIWERLFISGIGDAEALAESNPVEIAAVVSLCRETVHKLASHVNYFHIPVAVSPAVLVSKLDRIIDAVLKNMSRGKILIHSLTGANRVPIMAGWVPDGLLHKHRRSSGGHREGASG